MDVGNWLMAGMLLFTLLASPVCGIVHSVLALRRRNGTASRFILLGLLPSTANLIMIAHPGYTHAWFPGLRRFWPIEPTWLWLLEFLSYFWTTMPAFAALVIFGAELGRPDRFTPGMIRLGVCIAYVGVIAVTHSLLFGNWE